jgi:hypothetical protein
MPDSSCSSSSEDHLGTTRCPRDRTTRRWAPVVRSRLNASELRRRLRPVLGVKGSPVQIRPSRRRSEAVPIFGYRAFGLGWERCCSYPGSARWRQIRSGRDRRVRLRHVDYMMILGCSGRLRARSGSAGWLVSAGAGADLAGASRGLSVWIRRRARRLGRDRAARVWRVSGRRGSSRCPRTGAGWRRSRCWTCPRR